MRTRQILLGAVITVAGLALAAGCDRPTEHGIALEPPRVAGVNQSLDEVESGLAHARAMLRENPRGAEEALDRATRALARLRGFYVPLLEARQAAVNAMRHQTAGEHEAALAALDSIEGNLATVSARGLVSPAEVEATASLLARARSEIASGAAGVPAPLRDLALRLHDMLVKSGLVLREGS